MSRRAELEDMFKAFLDANYPCCEVPGCSGEAEEAKALVDMAFDFMRPLTAAEPRTITGLAAAPHLTRAVGDEAFGYAVSAIRGHGEFSTAEAEAAVEDIINALGLAK